MTGWSIFLAEKTIASDENKARDVNVEPHDSQDKVVLRDYFSAYALAFDD